MFTLKFAVIVLLVFITTVKGFTAEFVSPVQFTKAAPADGALEALRAAIKGPEQVAIVGRNAYLVYPDGIGRSKLTITVIEKKLGVRGTARNWNTVLKLAEMA